MTDARLLAPGEGEDISERLRIKCDLEPLAFTETVGSARTNPHVHETHVDGFWVLEPGFTVGIGDEEIELEPGDFALVPPGLVHYFKATDSRWLNLHAPNAGFAEYLRSGADFDDRDARRGRQPPRRRRDPAPRRRGRADRAGPGARGRVKVGADDAIGSVTVIDFELAPESAGPPPHLHERITDSFYVLEGTLTVLLGAGGARGAGGQPRGGPARQRAHRLEPERRAGALPQHLDTQRSRALSARAGGGSERLRQHRRAPRRDPRVNSGHKMLCSREE